MSPRMTGHFVKSTVRPRRKTRNFYNGEKVPSDQKKYRRTRKELTNESEKKHKELIIISKNLKWPGTFIIEKFRTAKSLPIESEKKCKELKMTGKSSVGLAKNL